MLKTAWIGIALWSSIGFSANARTDLLYSGKHWSTERYEDGTCNIAWDNHPLIFFWITGSNSNQLFDILALPLKTSHMTLSLDNIPYYDPLPLGADGAVLISRRQVVDILRNIADAKEIEISDFTSLDPPTLRISIDRGDYMPAVGQFTECIRSSR